MVKLTSTSLPLTFTIPAYRQRDTLLSTYLLRQFMTTGPVHSGDWKLGDQNNSWVSGHSERLPSIADLLKFGCCLSRNSNELTLNNSLCTTISPKYSTSYHLSVPLSPVLTLSEKLAKDHSLHFIGASLLIFKHILSCWFGASSLLSSYRPEITSNIFFAPNVPSGLRGRILACIDSMARKSDNNLPALSSPGLSPRSHPYSSSIASPASSSSSSLFSIDAPSSHSSAGSSSSRSPCAIWENENEIECSSKDDGSYKPSARTWKLSDPSDTKAQSPELEILHAISATIAHPRRSNRTGGGACARSLLRPPPPLVRQCERKESFVDSLVGKVAGRPLRSI